MRISDWSSDVCSSDLHYLAARVKAGKMLLLVGHARRSENIDPRIFGGDSAFPFQHLSDLGIHDQPGRVVENEDIGLVTVLGLEPRPFRDEIGRASCRDRVCQYV